MKPIARFAVVAALTAAVALAPIAQKGVHASSTGIHPNYSSGSCRGDGGFKIYQNSDGSGYCEQFYGSATISNLNATLWPGCTFSCNVYPNAWSSQLEYPGFGAGITCAYLNGNQVHASLSPGQGVTALPGACGNQVVFFSYSNA